MKHTEQNSQYYNKSQFDLFTRADYRRTRDRIFSENAQKSDGAEVAAEYAMLIDRILQGYFKKYFADIPDSVCLFALGGYGRVEVNPYSDIDILLVYEGESRHIQKSTKMFIQALWDIGLEIGHQFVTPQQCCELALEDVTMRTTVLEMRYIYGDTGIAVILEEQLNQHVFNEDIKQFTDQILNDTEQRHEKYGKSPQLLEPQIKEGVGGLRDLHVLLWLFRINRKWQERIIIKLDFFSSILNFIYMIRDLSLILKSDSQNLVSAFQFMMRVRSQLHLIYQRKYDLLEYGVQNKLARQLGYKDEEHWQAVENFMRDYYIHARRIYHSYRILSEKFSHLHETVIVEEIPEAKKLSTELYLVGNEIHLAPLQQELFIEKPAELMRIFWYRQQYGVRLSESLREVIYHAVLELNETYQFDQEAIQVFLQIVKEPNLLAENLRTMHELHLLDVFLPEFSALTALAQRDLYHYYSADEHTLIALENVTKLANEKPTTSHLAKVFHEIRNPLILFLGILFHDLGKAKSGDHTIKGVDIAKNILERWHIDREEKERILFLVRNHQKMEQTAFRRNIEEASTIRKFAKQVEDEENLKFLYILSYGDLSAVHPNVWTAWKGILMMELYESTKNYLHGRMKERKTSTSMIGEIAAKVQKHIPESFSQDDVVRHLKQMPSHYLDSFDEREIGEHLLLIDQLKTKPGILNFRNIGTHIVVTAVTRDKPLCLANICGVLSVHDLNIFSAQIFTRQDQIVVDIFRVIPVSKNIQFNDIQQQDIEEDLNKVLTGSSNLAKLFQRHRRKWKRRKFRKTDYPDEIEFDNQSSPKYTVIDVFTDDSIGLLYRLALAMSELGLNIQSAKIATRTDQVADSFYVIDQEGNKIEEEKKQEKIRQHLIKAIHREF